LKSARGEGSRLDKYLYRDPGEIQSFLSTSPVFKGIPAEDLAEIAELFRVEHYQAGTIILRQGGYSPALYFLRSGRLAVRIQRGTQKATVAYLQPPAIVGELSFLTGRCCSADVEVVVDAELIFLLKEDVAMLPRGGEAVFRGLLPEVAGRLHDTVTSGAKAPESPIVLLNNYPNWEAPFSFSSELASSLASQSGRQTLLANLGTSSPREVCSIAGNANACSLDMMADDENLRADVAQKLTEWKSGFANVLLNPVGPHRECIANAIRDLADFGGHLVGPGDPLPSETAGRHFTVQSAAHPTLPFLSCNQQLIYDAASSESAFASGRPVSSKFHRTVDSIARCIAGLQVGIVLGSGAAWGFAHIGVLSVLEDAKLPIDCISACSMGSVIGGLRSAGLTNKELVQFANDWRSHHRRLYELRFWRMSLFSEKAIVKFCSRYIDANRLVNQLEIPFWAGTLDIQTGLEFTIKDGTLLSGVRAATAMPSLLPPFPHNSHLFVDDIINPVPVNLAKQMGCHFIIAVNVMAQIQAHRVTHRWPLSALEIISRCIFLVAHEIGEAHAEEVADAVINPNPGKITWLEFGRGPEIIDCGRRAAEENLPAILASYESLKRG